MSPRALDDPGPFRVRVYSKAYAFLFQLSDVAVSVTPRHLAKGTGSITVPLSHNRFAALVAEGTRVTIDYFIGTDYADDASWLRVMSGPLWGYTIPQGGPTLGKVVTFNVEDDFRFLSQMLGWANPAAAIGSQTANAYDARNGVAETVIKAYVTANATRLGLPVTCATDLGRGSSVKGLLRFEPLTDPLVQLAQAGGLGIKIAQSGTGVVLDVYVPTDRTSRVLTQDSGAVLDWSLTTTGPAATRVVVAAQGSLTTRAFSAQADSATETLWGTKAEALVDARDTSDATTLTQRGAQALADGAPQVGYSLTLAETPVVRYGKTMQVGDRIAFQVIPGLVLTDTLSEVTLSWTSQDGFTVTPQVGSATSSASPDRLLARAVNAALTGVRKLRSGT